MQALRFPAIARDIITRIEETQSEALSAAADLYARSIANDGLVHLWGGGHSALGVLETFPRIGSIVGFHPILELPITYYSNVVGVSGLRQALFLERVSGLCRNGPSEFRIRTERLHVRDLFHRHQQRRYRDGSRSPRARLAGCGDHVRVSPTLYYVAARVR